MNITRIGNKILNSKLWTKLAPDNPTDIAAKIALASTTTKDAMNCYYYTKQSYNNEKIPEENRAFVAIMDAVNGILNVSIQLAMGTLVERKSAKIFDKLFGKHFDAAAAKRKFDELMKDKAAGLHNLNFSEKQIAERLKINQKWGKAGFKVLAVLFITQVFCKRVITPLIATPVTAFLKNKIGKKGENTEAKNESTTNDSKVVKPEAKNVAFHSTEASQSKPFTIDNNTFSAFRQYINA